MEGGVDDADDGSVVDDEADGDAEHGEDVGVVYSSLARYSVSIHVVLLYFIYWIAYHPVDQCTMLAARR